MIYRNEVKHEINAGDKAAIIANLRAVASPDPHVGKDGRYLIRSLYFDNLYDKALREKIDGVNEREKFRQKLTGEVFPNIKAELRGKIPAIIDEQLNAMLKKISDGFEEQINKQKHVIDSIAQESLQLEAQISEKTAVLENLANAVKAAANEHLYK